MTSVQDFEVNQRDCAVNIDEGILKDEVSTVKEVVENCDRKMAKTIISGELNKKHGGEIYITVAECGRSMFYVIRGLPAGPSAYKDGNVLVEVKVVETFNLLNLALREVMKMVKKRESVRVLEIPEEVKDIMMKYWE